MELILEDVTSVRLVVESVVISPHVKPVLLDSITLLLLVKTCSVLHVQVDVLPVHLQLHVLKLVSAID